MNANDLYRRVEARLPETVEIDGETAHPRGAGVAGRAAPPRRGGRARRRAARRAGRHPGRRRRRRQADPRRAHRGHRRPPRPRRRRRRAGRPGGAGERCARRSSRWSRSSRCSRRCRPISPRLMHGLTVACVPFAVAWTAHSESAPTRSPSPSTRWAAITRPDEIVRGVAQVSLEAPHIQTLLVGDARADRQRCWRRVRHDPERIAVHHAGPAVRMDEKPAEALDAEPDASIVGRRQAGRRRRGRRAGLGGQHRRRRCWPARAPGSASPACAAPRWPRSTRPRSAAARRTIRSR